jgi:hypothetical protein
MRFQSATKTVLQKLIFKEWFLSVDIMIQNPTRHTLDQAKHHLSEMKETFQDDERFSFNLSSFVYSV